jgi:ABC-type methionine transport system ATPase subunit
LLASGAGAWSALGALKKHIHFEFSEELVKTPLLYQLNRKFDVVVNIRGASVTETGGFLALELEGEQAEIDRVVTFLQDQSVEVHDGLGDAAP